MTALRMFNAALSRLKRLKIEPSAPLLLYGLRISIRAENPAAVKVYLKMLLDISQGNTLIKTA